MFRTNSFPALLALLICLADQTHCQAQFVMRKEQPRLSGNSIDLNRETSVG